MKIHEYQAIELMRRAGVSVTDGYLAVNPDQAAAAFDRLGVPMAVVKAQVHAGGRGKGGGVKLVHSRDQARQAAAAMFEQPLVTHQTGPAGRPVRKVLVAAGVDIRRELYVGVVVDRARRTPVIMACAEGGVEIEEIAARSPEKIVTEPVDPTSGLHPFRARRLAFALGLDGALQRQAERLLIDLCRVFLDNDASLAEINPLVVTADDRLVAIDAKINLDDNAAYRHPEWEDMRDPEEEDAAERRAQANGLSYVSLDGTIGCLVNGAGLAMSTMDIIKLHGGEPANFLDVGGGADTEQVTEGFRILLSDPRVKAVLVNIFGGIMKCDVIAAAILAAYRELRFSVPLIVRLEGTNVEQGRRMLAESGLSIIGAADLAEAAQKAVQVATGS